MEYSCAKDDLLQGVQKVEKIVSTRSTLPIIGNILFETAKSGIKMSANNLEMGMEVTVPAKIKKEGSVLIPAKTIGGIVSKLPSSNVNFKVSEKGVVKISYNESNLNVRGLPSDEFPMLPKIKEGRSYSIDPKVFSSMVEQTIFAVSTSEEKYVLNGVLIEIGRGEMQGDTSNIRMVATDGYRLARRGEKISGQIGAGVKAIVPAKALVEVSRMLQDGGGEEVKMTIASEQISFKHKDSYLVSRIIQGQFPDYKQVIPKSSEIKVEVDLKALLEASERAAVIASGSANIVKFEAKMSKLRLSANTPDVGSADEVVDVKIKGKSQAQVAFNIRLITDALKSIEEEKVLLELSGPLSPGILRPIDGPDYVYIVMPIRTSETSA